MLAHCPVLDTHVFITRHAAERFIERCEPAVHDVKAAHYQLAHQLRYAQLTCPPGRQRPDRVHTYGTYLYMHSGVGIVMDSRVTTVLAYGMKKFKRRPREGVHSNHSGRRKRAQARLRSLRILDSHHDED